MSVVRRENQLIGLKNLDVFIEDPGYNSDYFKIIDCPSILTQGKSSFLIGGSQYLKSGVDLKVELVNDENDEVIYTTPVFGHLEAGSRRVSIEVYEDVTPGSHTLYVVGELNPSTVSVPQEWQGTYNVRWSRQITVSGTGVNTEPIYFYKQPSITVKEIFRGYLDTPTQLTSSVYLTGSGTPREGLPPLVPIENTTVGGQATTATYPELDFANKSKLAIIENNRPLVKLSGRHGHVGSKGMYVKPASPPPDDYLIGLSSTTPVNSLYVGNTFTINNPQVNTSRFTLQSYHEVPGVYNSTVMKVIKDTVFVPKDVFYVYDNRTSPATLVPAPLASQYITASYQDLTTQTPSTINYFSYADIQLTDLKTFSGDVHKVKVYAKGEGSIGDFEKIYDSPIESSEILFDGSDNTLLGNMGFWVGQTRLNQYWEAFQGQHGNGGSGTITYHTSSIMDAMEISGSNLEYNHELRVQLKKTGSFIAGNSYTFRSNLYGIKTKKKDIDGNSGKKGEFFIYASGSAFNKDTLEGSQWGSQKLFVPDFPNGVDSFNFGVIEGNFIADNTGPGTIQFKVPSGKWYISDISVKASSDTAFSPDYVQVIAPVPPLYTRPDKVKFLVEFYDVNNNIADTVIFSDKFEFQGQNLAIGGVDNILSGSMTMGNALYEGIEMAGLSSAYVRSIGYEGFSSASNAQGTNSGFVMWSGSILPDSGDSYAGVGLELVGSSTSYLRFRTEPSDLDIRADSFFVGNPSTQFISGSGNKIEISSSNFHVDPGGDVTMTGTITATAGNIGGATITSDRLAYLPYWAISASANTNDPVSFISSSKFKVSADGQITGSQALLTGGNIGNWEISNGNIVGSNITMDADGSRIYKTDSNNELSGFYMDFTPGSNYYVRFGTDFAVSSSGTLIASGAVIEGVVTASGGYIGNWTIGSNSIYKITDTKFTGMSSIGNTRFFAGSDTLVASGSAPFNVTATGDITGSQVLFTGGKIAGWDITNSRINSPDGDMRLTSSNPKITIGTHTIGNGPGIQLGYDSGNTLTFFAGQSANDYIKYTAGTGIDIKTQRLEVSTLNIDISSAQASMSLGEGKIVMQGASSPYIAINNGNANQILIKTDGSDSFMTMGSKTSFTHEGSGTAGILIGMDDNNPQAEFVKNTSNYFIFDGTSGVDIKTTNFELDANNLEVSSTQASMSLGEGKIVLQGGSTSTITVGSSNGILLSDDGTDRFMTMGSKSSFSHFDQSTAGIILGVDSGVPKLEMAGSANNYFSFDGTNLDIKITEGFELDATNIEISSQHASMSLGEGNIKLLGASNKIEVGANSNKRIDIVGSGTVGYIATGKTSAASTTAGFWLANNNTDPEFHVGDASEFIKFDGGNLNIEAGNLEIDATNIEISSTQASMSLGEGRIIMVGGTTSTITVGATSGKQVLIAGSTSTGTISTGKTSVTDTTAGFWLGNNNADPEFSVGDATEFIKFDGGNLNIEASNFELDANNIEISSNQASMSLGEGNIIMHGASSKIDVGPSNTVTIQGGAADNFIVFGAKQVAGTGFATFNQSTAGVILGMDSTVPKFEMVGSATNYFSFNGSNLDIKLSQGFELDATNIQLSSAHASASFGVGKIKILGASGRINVGTTAVTGSISIQGGAADNFIVMGEKNNSSTSYPTTVTTAGGKAGISLGIDSGVTKFEMAESSGSFFKFDTTDGLDIQTTKMEVSASNIQISSTQASMSIGDPDSTGGAVVLQADGDDKMLRFGTKTTFDQDNVDGFIMGINAADNKPEFDFTVGTGDDQYIRMTSAGIFMKVPSFELDTTTLDISSTGQRLQVFNVSGSEVVRLGEISDDASDLHGIKIYDGSGGVADANTIAKFGSEGNKIAGWEVTETQIRTIPDSGFGGQFADGENGLILHSGGRIESADFVTNVKGWRIDTLGNGTAEFENARIRGTLSTAVFEKESVNVVGGQLMVANSTTLQPLRSGSLVLAGVPSMSATDVTMSVANASGFRAGEILKAKKVNDTGFTVEYLYITGSKRYSVDPTLAHITASAVDPDGLAGELYVGRGYGQSPVTGSVVSGLTVNITETVTSMSLSSFTGFTSQSILKIDEERMKVVSMSDSGFIGVLRDFHDTTAATHTSGALVHVIDTDKEFIGGLVSTSQSYNEGQVFASTGLYSPTEDIHSGYIVLNAKPNDISTPYMDIIERTGSGVYDLQLRTRIGDLSGISSNYLYGDEEPGFGIYTENGFFRGALHAMTGSIHGILHVATTQGGIETGRKISIGRQVSGTQDGIYINNNNYWYTDAEWRVGDSSNYLHLSGSGGNLASDLTIKLEKFELNAGSGDLKISSTEKSMSFGNGDIEFQSVSATQARGHIGAGTSNRIYISGSSTEGYIYSGKPTYDSSTAGFWLGQSSNTAKFNIGDGTDYIKFSGAAITMAARTFALNAGSGDLDINSAGKYIKLADSKIILDGSGNFGYIRVGGSGAVAARIHISGSSTFGVIKAGKTSSTDTVQAGWILEKDSSNSTFYVGDSNDGNYVKFTTVGSAGMDIKTQKFQLDAGGGNLRLTSTQSSMSLADDKVLLYGGNSNNGYIRVGNNATSDYINNIHISGSGALSVIRTGKISVTDTTAGFWLGRNGTDSEFSIGDATNSMVYNGGSLAIDVQSFELAAGVTKLQISSTEASMSLASGNITLDGDSNSGAGHIEVGTLAGVDPNTTNVGIYAKGNGEILIKAGSAVNKDYLLMNSSGLTIRTTDLDILTTGAGKLKIDSDKGSGTPVIAMGSTIPNAYNDGQGFYIDGGGNCLIGNSGGDKIQFAGSGNLIIVSSNIDITSTTFSLNASSGRLIIESSTPRIVLSNSAAYLKIGTVSSVTDTTADTKGFYAEGDGDFLAKAGPNEYMRFNGGNMSISASVFTMNAGNGQMYMNSATREINLNGNTFGSDGIQLQYNSGNPRFYVGNGAAGASGEALIFDGFNLHISSSNLSLDHGAGGTSPTLTLGGPFGTTDDVVVMSPTNGVKIYDNSTDYVHVHSTGMDVIAGGEKKAIFGEISVIGSDTAVTTTSTDSLIRLTGGGVALYQDSNNYASMSSAGMKLYQGGSHVATFGSTITLAPSVAAPTTDSVVISSGGPKIYDNAYDYTHVSPDGLKVYRELSGAAKLISQFGSEIDLYSLEATPLKYFNAASDGISIGKNADGGAAVINTVRLPAAGDVYLYGDNTSTYSKMSSAGLQVYKDGAGDSGLVATYGTNTVLTGGTMTIQGTTGGVGHDKVHIHSTGMYIMQSQSRLLDIVDGKINIGPAAVAGTAVIGNVRVESGAVYMYGDHTSTYSVMSSGGLAVYKNGTGHVADFGATMRVGLSAADKSALRVAADGSMSIGTTGTKKFSVAADGTVEVEGSITITGGNAATTTNVTDAQAAATAAGQAAAANTEVSASATSLAYSAGAASSASAAASTAQDAIDEMETQVELTSTGMKLKADNTANAALNGQTIAEYGTTTYFYDGVAHAAANIKLQLQAAGVTTFGDTIYQKSILDSSGLTIYDDRSSVAVNVANFGATVRVGENETTKSALRVAADGSMTIGTSNTTNFSVSTGGDITGTNMILEGAVRGDVFTYSYKTITTTEFIDHYERFTYDNGDGDKNYIYWDLGGTLDGETLQANAAQFYRLEAGAANDNNGNSVGTSALPVAVMRAPNPRDENNFNIGSFIAIEAANHTVHFQNQIGTGAYSVIPHHTTATSVENNRFSSDSDDTYGPHTDGPGGTYGTNSCMAFATGGRVFVVKNKYGWRIVGTSSVQGMEHVIHATRMSVNDTAANNTYGLWVGTGGIGTSGDVVAYVSDKRLKKDLVKIDNPVEILQKLTGYQFTWNEKAVKERIGRKDLGLIAQEVEEVLPEAVTDFLQPGSLTVDGTTETYKAVLYDRIVPVLLGGINQLDDELGTVRNVMDQQERQIVLLKKRVETMETMKYLQSTWNWLENVKKFLKLK